MSRASFLACLRREFREGRAGSFEVVMQSPFMSACDPLLQAERRFKAQCLNQSRWDLFPCRGPVVPCCTLSVVSATCTGTVKPLFRPISLRFRGYCRLHSHRIMGDSET